MTFRELRELHGFRTHARLSAATGGKVKQATVSNFDHGKASDAMYSTIEAIADAMGISPQIVIRSIRESARKAAQAA